MSTSIIILKPNKAAYDSSKIFQPIVLFNTLGKFIKKVISERLQTQSISSNFVHSNQLGGLKQHSTTNAGLFLTHLIYTGWVTGLYMSTLAFDIAQFFPSLNHHLLSLILNKACFDLTISSFFSNYLIDRKIWYVWNNFISLSFRADMSVSQGSALSPILSTLYITPIFHISEKRSKNLLPNIPISFHSFMYDGLFYFPGKKL